MEPGFKSTSNQLRWPRSDGNPAIWPETNVKNDKTESWFEKVPYDSPKMTYYRKKNGTFLADEVLKIKGAHNSSMDFPKGYALFVHMQPAPDGSGHLREDFYWYGSENAPRFRSFPEWQPHAEWLMDTSRPLDDHTTCNCKYNKSSKIAIEKRQNNQKRANEDEKTDPSKRTKLDSKDDGTVVIERATDWRSKRRFRKGELVFFRIETIRPPNGSGLPEITHWPGLISHIVEKSIHDGQEAEASVASAWTLFGAVAPEALQKSAVRKVWSHSIRALGMFSNATEVHNISTSDILPWAAGVELLGGPDGWRKIVAEGNRTLDEGVRREAKDDPPSMQDMNGPELEARWKKRWGERIPFERMPRQYEAVVLRLSVALSIGEKIASSWSQTDKILVIPPNSTLTPGDMEDLANNRKSLFQGLWLRGERIWLDDVVVLRKTRLEIPATNVLLGPSPGAESCAVLLQIRNIALEISPAADGSQAKPTPTQQGGDLDSQQSWRCVFYGDLYELATGEAPAITPDPDAPHRRPINVKAPKGYYYRCIHADGSEVMLDVFDIAGRIYPDLFESDSAYFYSPFDRTKAGRVQAGETVMSLVGLRPCPTAHATSTTWKEDLYIIVRDSTMDMERDARNSYGEKLCKELNYPVPDFKAVVEKPSVQSIANVNGTANGNGAPAK